MNLDDLAAALQRDAESLIGAACDDAVRRIAILLSSADVESDDAFDQWVVTSADPSDGGPVVLSMTRLFNFGDAENPEMESVDVAIEAEPAFGGVPVAWGVIDGDEAALADPDRDYLVPRDCWVSHILSALADGVARHVVRVEVSS